jgi:hypothetical protein
MTTLDVLRRAENGLDDPVTYSFNDWCRCGVGFIFRAYKGDFTSKPPIARKGGLLHEDPVYMGILRDTASALMGVPMTTCSEPAQIISDKIKARGGSRLDAQHVIRTAIWALENRPLMANDPINALMWSALDKPGERMETAEPSPEPPAEPPQPEPEQPEPDHTQDQPGEDSPAEQETTNERVLVLA